MKETIKTIKELLDWYNKTFPNNAPHHIVVMGEKEYKRYNEVFRNTEEYK